MMTTGSSAASARPYEGKAAQRRSTWDYLIEDMETVANVFACLVHENFDCVVDLLRNLNYFDPGAPILLYNGSANPDFLNGRFPFERFHARLIPGSHPLHWGRLHDFALDCFQFALQHYTFSALTIVDSDQLLIRGGYSAFLQAFLQDKPKAGLLGSTENQFGPQTSQHVARVAEAESELWRPLVERFEGDPHRFVRWSFWPATVFTYPAVQDIVKVFLYEPQLQQILSRTRIHATEEVIFPTLVGLLGYEVGANPCSYQFIRYKVNYTPEKLEQALRTTDAYWLHPIPRRYEDPLRKALRARFDHWAPACHPIGDGGRSPDPPLFLTLPILQQAGRVDGWLDDEEADLLIAITRDVVKRQSGDSPGAIVEVGSYCGKASLVIGLTLQRLGAGRFKLYAIDPHDGRVGSLDQGIVQSPPTYEKFCHNIAAAGLTSLVEPLRARSCDVRWERPVALLLIDGLHDYPNVARDFLHFAPWVQPRGLVAFHDAAEYYPGVTSFVAELLCGGEYRLRAQVKSLAVLQKAA